MPDLLVVSGVSAGYGDAVVLDDVSLSVGAGERLAVLGRNGVGKTTLLLTLMGFTHVRRGAIRWDGGDLLALPPFRRARAGLGWVPQERGTFPSLTVEEHLTSVARPGPWNARRVYDLFPGLEERKARMGDQLSGGEQQMLAFGRALVVNPRLLLLDEPLEGLAPTMARHLVDVLRGLSDTAIVLVEQHARVALSLTDRAILLERGKVAYRAESKALLKDPATLRRLLALSGSDRRTS
jgi:branched-chain amino acid transport system ATP-binding protein